MGTNGALIVETGQAGTPLEPHRIMLTLVPGGRVTIANEALPSTGAVELLSLRTGRIDTLFLERERVIGFPAGDALAVAFSAPKQVVGMTRPWRMAAGDVHAIKQFPRPSRDRGDLLVSATYPIGEPRDRHDVRVALKGPLGEQEPFASTNAPADVHYSAFYRLAPGKHELQVLSRYWRAADAVGFVEAGRLTLKEVQLLAKPALTVQPISSADTIADYQVQLYECEQSSFGPGTGEWPDLSRCKLRTAEHTSDQVTIPWLDAQWYFLLVSAGPRRVGRQIDLRAGNDQTEVIDWQHVRLHGKVLRSDAGIVADLIATDLASGNSEPPVRSGSDGSYEAKLSGKGFYNIAITPLGEALESAAAFQLSVPADATEVQKDFVVPRGGARVIVRRYGDRQPIAGATVVFTNAGASNSRMTDDVGETALPLLSPGTFKCRVRAPGYRDTSDSFTILDTDALQKLEVLLKPMRDDLSFQVRLAGTGSPAASGWVVAVADGYVIREENQCDANGVCSLAEKTSDQEPLLLIHRSAGLTIVPLGIAVESKVVTLAAAAGPFRVPIARGPRTERSTLRISVAVNGIWVPDHVLAMLASVLGDTYRVFLLPQMREQPFLIQGLAAGTATVSISEVVKGSSAATPILTGIQLQVPNSTQLPIQLP